MQRKIIIGDIHGCYDELIKLLEKVELKNDDVLISLGDIVDRGAKSKQVFDYLSTRPNTIVLMGNHERKHLNGVLSYAQEIVKVQFGENYPSFLDWISSLKYCHETDEAIIVHAAFENDVPLNKQRQEVLCGATAGERYLEKKYGPEVYWTDYYAGQKPIIYGHHVVGSDPKIINNTYGIDTGACHNGWLTAIELPGFIIHQVKAEDDYWAKEQKMWQLPVLASKDWVNMEFGNIRKMLDKLNFVEDPIVKQALVTLNNWVNDLQNQLLIIKSALDSFTIQLVNNYPDTFNMEAGKFTFKTFLYRSRAGNLTLHDVQKSLNTPSKIIELTDALKLKPLSVFKLKNDQSPPTTSRRQPE